MAVPDTFQGVKVTVAKADKVGDQVPYAIQHALNSLGGHQQFGTLEARTIFGQAALDLGDGQGRGYVFHSSERHIQKEINRVRKLIRRKEKAFEDTSAEKAELKLLEAKLVKIQKFLSETSVAVMIYADSITETGQVVGLPVKAEQRLYIEGNALNSRAAQEEVVKYEHYSPVIDLLKQIRKEHIWMNPDFIEEDSKTIGSNSTKLFTLSALVQGFSFSLVDHNQPIRKSSPVPQGRDPPERRLPGDLPHGTWAPWVRDGCKCRVGPRWRGRGERTE
jgi:hypothetical protein